MIAVALVFWISRRPDPLHPPRLPARAAWRWSPCVATPTLEPRHLGGAAAAVSLIVAAHDEEQVIAAKVANALALDYPRERLEVIVASDGSADATVERARAAGADLVLDLPRGGKVAAQNAAAERASGEILAFSDANSAWAPDALRHLVEPFADPASATSAARSASSTRAATTSRAPTGATRWRCGRWSPAWPGSPPATGRSTRCAPSAYVPLPPSGSHDLSFPFLLAKRGQRSLYVPWAAAEEKMVPTVEGEFARKRRMMVGLWDIVVRRRDAAPSRLLAALCVRGRLAQVGALRDPAAARRRPCRERRPARPRLGLHGDPGRSGRAARCGAAGPLAAAGPLRVARYYVLTTASIAAGLWDRLRHGPPGAWEKAEGTR